LLLRGLIFASLRKTTVGRVSERCKSLGGGGMPQAKTEMPRGSSSVRAARSGGIVAAIAEYSELTEPIEACARGGAKDELAATFCGCGCGCGCGAWVCTDLTLSNWSGLKPWTDWISTLFPFCAAGTSLHPMWSAARPRR
jgi:hypothetical protein